MSVCAYACVYVSLCIKEREGMKGNEGLCVYVIGYLGVSMWDCEYVYMSVAVSVSSTYLFGGGGVHWDWVGGFMP